MDDFYALITGAWRGAEQLLSQLTAVVWDVNTVISSYPRFFVHRVDAKPPVIVPSFLYTIVRSMLSTGLDSQGP
jgi:hypothetical protein